MSKSDLPQLTHLDAEGNPRMVNVGEKPITSRVAVATGRIVMDVATREAIVSGQTKKGNALLVAELPSWAPPLIKKRNPNPKFFVHFRLVQLAVQKPPRPPVSLEFGGNAIFFLHPKREIETCFERESSCGAFWELEQKNKISAPPPPPRW